MKIYIASSWKNQHGVEMLTEQLRQGGHEVLSFIENNFGEGYTFDKQMPFEEWIKTESANRSFHYDTNGAMYSDLVIYLGPSGIDAWAEIGAAFGSGRTIIGLWAKGEQVGLMQRMISKWFNSYRDLLDFVGEKNAEK